MRNEFERFCEEVEEDCERDSEGDLSNAPKRVQTHVNFPAWPMRGWFYIFPNELRCRMIINKKKTGAICSWKGNKTVILHTHVLSQHHTEVLIDRKPHLRHLILVHGSHERVNSALFTHARNIYCARARGSLEVEEEALKERKNKSPKKGTRQTMMATEQGEATGVTDKRTCDEEEEEETEEESKELLQESEDPQDPEDHEYLEEEDTEEPEDIAEGEEDSEDDDGEDRGRPVKNRVRTAGREQFIELGTLNVRAQPPPSTQARGKYSRPPWRKDKRRNTISEERVIPDSKEERVNKGEGLGHRSISGQPDSMPPIISSPLSSPPATLTSWPAYFSMPTEVLPTSPPISRPSPSISTPPSSIIQEVVTSKGK
ncbi:hypothetical protein L873DRAFT_1841631 [Choiromyces venosus 120613-1]|uniref:Uncharacterized protein n=1 Tax=Choiromyces venosus 120613-1 TaxID=1336337 RepID=A0A3N4JWS0_9PEZI|nr:hypothetical protein L873DRAFT_1841631 [Choiromyces venosus 120613-1]